MGKIIKVFSAICILILLSSVIWLTSDHKQSNEDLSEQEMVATIFEYYEQQGEVMEIGDLAPGESVTIQNNDLFKGEDSNETYYEYNNLYVANDDSLFTDFSNYQATAFIFGYPNSEITISWADGKIDVQYEGEMTEAAEIFFKSLIDLIENYGYKVIKPE